MVAVVPFKLAGDKFPREIIENGNQGSNRAPESWDLDVSLSPKGAKQCGDATTLESIHNKDESKHGPQYKECNGMTSFMEFMESECSLTNVLKPTW